MSYLLSMVPRILIVDDEHDFIELLQYKLAGHGYDLIVANDGVHALSQARTQKPNLILLDILLPDLDGLSVCEILRRLPSTAPIPVIMLTAWKSELTRIIGLDSGAEDYITKPFSPRDLVARVKNTLRTQAEKEPRNGSAE